MTVASPIVVLSWNLAGRTWRVGTRSCQPVSVDGRLQVLGGLPVSDVDESMEIASSEVSSSWSTDFLPPAILAEMVDEDGHVLEAESAEVSVWSPGDAWEDRVPVIRGQATLQSWGPLKRKCRITIDQDPSTYSDEYPPSDAVVDGDTWTAPQEVSDDQPYPFVVGHPGVFWRKGSSVNYSGTPAYIIAGDASTQNKYLLIAGHLTDQRTETRWRIRDDTQGVEDNFTDAGGVQEYDDGLGRPVTILGLSEITATRAQNVAVAYADGDSMYCQWTGSGGQIWRDVTLERAGDVLTWGLERAGMNLDWARCGTARGILPWPLAGYWDQRCRAWDWVRDQLQPILPISLRVGRDGVYPVVWPWWGDSSWAIDHLRQGQDVSLDPVIRRPESDPVSGIQVRYARSAATGEYLEQVHIQTEPPTGRGISRHLGARANRLWTPGEPRTTDADMVWSPTTAGCIAHWQAEYYLRRRTVYTLRGRYSRLMNISLGDIVLITLTDPVISRRRAMVTGKNISGRGGTISLEVTCW